MNAKMKPFAGLNEEEVVALAQNGNEEALLYMLGRYKQSVRMKSKTYFMAGGDWEDVVQEGMIGLFKAIRSFDSKKNASFRTFAELCITRHIITAVKSATRQKHMPLNCYVSLSGGESNDYYEASVKRLNLNPEQIVIERENYSGMEGDIERMLSHLEAEVLSFHLQGMGYQEIADKLGRSPKSIDNALQRIKKKLETLMVRK